ncbi:MAG: hypothetical protein JKY34_05855 [Kordiimonadaceae bacterium]|nr:hypothetical protein [Kordiimonadaceae bacterium]
MAKLAPVLNKNPSKTTSVREATGTLAAFAVEASAVAEKENGQKSHDEIAESKASQAHSRMRAMLRQKKTFSLGQIPAFVVDEFNFLREAKGMEQREFFYHLLREAGAEIPEYDKMDGRRY